MGWLILREMAAHLVMTNVTLRTEILSVDVIVGIEQSFDSQVLRSMCDCAELLFG